MVARNRRNALTVLVLVLFSATFHTLVRNNLEASLHMASMYSVVSPLAATVHASQAGSQVSAALQAALFHSDGNRLGEREPPQPLDDASMPTPLNSSGNPLTAKEQAALRTAAVPASELEVDGDQVADGAAHTYGCDFQLRLLLWNIQQEHWDERVWVGMGTGCRCGMCVGVGGGVGVGMGVDVGVDMRGRSVGVGVGVGVSAALAVAVAVAVAVTESGWTGLGSGELVGLVWSGPAHPREWPGLFWSAGLVRSGLSSARVSCTLRPSLRALPFRTRALRTCMLAAVGQAIGRRVGGGSAQNSCLCCGTRL